MWPNPQGPGSADLVTFTEKILNGKLHFLCSESSTIFSEFFVNHFQKTDRLLTKKS